MVSEEKTFEIVDGRTDDGWTPDHGYPISSPVSPSELKRGEWGIGGLSQVGEKDIKRKKKQVAQRATMLT